MHAFKSAQIHTQFILFISLLSILYFTRRIFNLGRHDFIPNSPGLDFLALTSFNLPFVFSLEILKKFKNIKSLCKSLYVITLDCSGLKLCHYFSLSVNAKYLKGE